MTSILLPFFIQKIASHRAAVQSCFKSTWRRHHRRHHRLSFAYPERRDMGQSTTTMNLTLHVTLQELLVNARRGLFKPRHPQVTQAHLPNLDHLKELFHPRRLGPPNPRPKRQHALTELLPPVLIPLIRNLPFPAVLHTTPPDPLQNRLYLPQLKPLRRRR